MNNWKAFFTDWASAGYTRGEGIPLKGRDMEHLYQAFKARGEAEAKEEQFPEINCPLYGVVSTDPDLWPCAGCYGACQRSLEKPPEPECEHKDGLGCSFKNYTVYGKIPGENFPYVRCPLCGKKLE
ncbi:hypothetical protein LCGC14_0813040 [marine sediment metagenome]|uniref:Uncharacterized protein n=1 Tax=marine sediment metagenome TaxID=412755 RepID=A0A0F9PQP7_9ZZZZ